MAWTYTSSPSTSTRDALRYLIGDVVAGSTTVTYPTLSDSEIAYELAQTGNVRAAAANAARALAARYAVQPHEKQVGDLSLTYGDRATDLLAIAANLDSDAALYAVPVAGGISYADKQNVELDTDRVVPSFARGWAGDDIDSRTSSTGPRRF